MKNSKKAIALFLILIFTFLLEFPTMAAPNQAVPILIGVGGDISIQPFYTRVCSIMTKQPKNGKVLQR